MMTPIQLPDLPWEHCEFDPVSPVSVSRMESRRTETAVFGAHYWRMSLQSVFLETEEVGLFDAFMMRADARVASIFIGHDVFRPRPVAHDNGRPLSGTRAGGGAFDGTATLQSITDSRTLVVSGLPPAFRLAAGDYVEVRMNPVTRSLHRIEENAQAGANGVVTLKIMFYLDLQNFDTTAIVNFEKAGTVMGIDPGSVRSPKGWGSRQVSFSATEMFPGVPA